MAEYDFSKYDDKKKEVAQLKKDIFMAKDIVNDAIKVYVKKKLKARSKKQTKELKELFSPLKEYGSRNDVQEAYGYGQISRKEYENLLDLWDKKDNFVKNNKFEDRVSLMLEKAMNQIGDEYQDELFEIEDMDRLLRKQVESN